MNIFYLDKNPYVAASYMVDKHVVKMILESAQLLSTAHRVLDGEKEIYFNGKRRATKYNHYNENLYKATHVNHPSAVWVRESNANYVWLFRHFMALMDEYYIRFNKHHACGKLIKHLCCCPTEIQDKSMTKMPCAMGNEYIISDDPVINYRNYYKLGKSHLHKWTNREIPDWIKNG